MYRGTRNQKRPPHDNQDRVPAARTCPATHIREATIRLHPSPEMRRDCTLISGHWCGREAAAQARELLEVPPLRMAVGGGDIRVPRCPSLEAPEPTLSAAKE